MFRHVVLFTFTGQQTADQVQALTEALRGLPGVIPEIRAYHVGTDAGINPANYHYAVVADFDGPAEYLAYRDHPAHREVIKQHVSPIVATRAAVQYHL